MEHTKEPWTFDEFGDGTIRAKSWGVIAIKPPKRIHCNQEVEAIGNFNRIVACINGCEGINPEAVGEMLRALKSIRSCHLKPGEMCPSCKNHLDTAIAKADG